MGTEMPRWGEAMALVLLGAWLAMSACMWFAATASFGTVRRVLEGGNPQFSEATRQLTPEQTRMASRHLTSEINRTYFRAYGWAQVVFGLALLFVVFRQTPRSIGSLVVVGAMFAVVLVLTFYVTPQIIELGRRLDFVSRTPPPPEWPRFRMLHGAFTILDGIKVLAGLGLLASWLRGR